MLQRDSEYHGTKGLAAFAVAMVDTALRDCLGGAHGVPCRQLWGGIHSRIPAYAVVPNGPRFSWNE